jgi:uncharacterized membrane protein
MAQPAISDHEVELRLATLLRVGVFAAAALVLAGGVLYLVKYGALPPHHATYTGEPDDLKRVSGIVRGAFALSGRGLIQLGLLVLIATPVARVGFSLYAFARQRDRTYVLITAVVLVLLVGSLLQL